LNIGYNPHLGYEADVLRDYEKAVHSIARKYRGCVNGGMDYGDLFSVGTMGLLEAFRNYDPDRFDGKVKSFNTYAFPMIEWSIQRFLRDKRYSVRVPRAIQEKSTRIRKQGWEQETAEKIAELSGWDLADAIEAKQFIDGWSVTSLDKPVTGKDDDELLMMNLLPSTEDFTRVNVEEFMSYLTETEQVVIRMRLNGASQGSISKRVDISQAHISRILSRIGAKYDQFQNGELEEGAIDMGRPRIKPEVTVFEKNNSIEWFIDEGVPTNPTVGLNAQGIHLNRRAVHELGCKAGQCVQVGYDSSENRLLIRVDSNGLKLRSVSGDTGGGLRLVNNRLADWLQQKELPLKRYVLHADRNSGIHYVYLDRHA